MVRAEASTPLPVYGTPSHSSAPWIRPSSPPGPCSEFHARANFSRGEVLDRRSLGIEGVRVHAAPPQRGEHRVAGQQ